MRGFVIAPFILLGIVVILVIAGVIYYFVYKSIINKKIENREYETGGSRRRLPSFGGVIAFILTILVIVGYINFNNKLNDIDDELSRANYNIELLGNRIYHLEDEISSLKEELIKQDSNVNYLKYSFGNYYEEDHTADVTFKLSLKNYSKTDVISLYFSEWGTTGELTQTGGGIFEGKIRTDIFNKIPDQIQYAVENDDTVATGMVMPESGSDEYDVTQIWEYYLLYPKYDIVSSEYKYNNGTLSYEIQGEIIPMNYVGHDISGFVKSVKIVTKLDDKVIDEYQTAAADCSFNLKESIEVRADQKLEFYAELTDKYGFIYRIPMTGWYDNTECLYISGMTIYNKDGNLLKEVYVNM